MVYITNKLYREKNCTLKKRIIDHFLSHCKSKTSADDLNSLMLTGIKNIEMLHEDKNLQFVTECPANIAPPVSPHFISNLLHFLSDNSYKNHADEDTSKIVILVMASLCDKQSYFRYIDNQADLYKNTDLQSLQSFISSLAESEIHQGSLDIQIHSSRTVTGGLQVDLVFPELTH